MLEFKIDVMKELKEKGYNTKVIRDKNLIGQKTVQDIKRGIVPGTKVLNTLCGLLNRQPGSIIKYVPEDLKEKNDNLT